MPSPKRKLEEDNTEQNKKVNIDNSAQKEILKEKKKINKEVSLFYYQLFQHKEGTFIYISDDMKVFKAIMDGLLCRIEKQCRAEKVDGIKAAIQQTEHGVTIQSSAIPAIKALNRPTLSYYNAVFGWLKAETIPIKDFTELKAELLYHFKNEGTDFAWKPKDDSTINFEELRESLCKIPQVKLVPKTNVPASTLEELSIVEKITPITKEDIAIEGGQLTFKEGAFNYLYTLWQIPGKYEGQYKFEPIKPVNVNVEKNGISEEAELIQEDVQKKDSYTEFGDLFFVNNRKCIAEEWDTYGILEETPFQTEQTVEQLEVSNFIDGDNYLTFWPSEVDRVASEANQIIKNAANIEDVLHELEHPEMKKFLENCKTSSV